MNRYLTVAMVLGFVSVIPVVEGGLVTPASYSMPNGNGAASGGGFNYWDKLYTGSGATTVDNAPLSGGLGDLTDGIVSSENWNVVENIDGTGPYVGWNQVDPTINFFFDSPVKLDTVRVHVDDSNGFGGVYLPAHIDVTINGNLYSIFPGDDADSAPRWFDFEIPFDAAPASQVTISLTRRFSGGNWVFADEAQFIVVPEPSAVGLLIPAGMTLIRRRR